MAASTSLTPAQRSQRARLAAFAKHARHDSRESTKPARDAFMARFLPDDPGLTEAERHRRAKAALNAHMASLALRSSKARTATEAVAR